MTQNKGIFDKKDAEKTSEFRKVANSYRSGWQYAEIGFQYGASIVLCTLGGYWLDKWLETGNIFLIIGVLFGSVAGFVNLMRSVNYKNKNTGKDGR